MTSEQVMLTLVALLLAVAGCAHHSDPAHQAALQAPYARPQVWAVAPLANESGSHYADGVAFADQLARQLETARGLQVLSVSRVLAAMDLLQMRQINSPAQLQQLRRTLGADAMVVGAMTAYDPYDPPRLGLTLELHGGADEPAALLDVRGLSHAARDEITPWTVTPAGPLSSFSGFFDASDPAVRERLRQYAERRGRDDREEAAWRNYRLSIDLYTEFVSYLASSGLLQAETLRLSPPEPAADPAS